MTENRTNHNGTPASPTPDAGELLADIDPISHAGRPPKNHSQPVSGFRLGDFGIGRMDSHRWQLEAELSDAMFEASITTTREAGTRYAKCVSLIQPYRLAA